MILIRKIFSKKKSKREKELIEDLYNDNNITERNMLRLGKSEYGMLDRDGVSYKRVRILPTKEGTSKVMTQSKMSGTLADEMIKKHDDLILSGKLSKANERTRESLNYLKNNPAKKVIAKDATVGAGVGGVLGGLAGLTGSDTTTSAAVGAGIGATLGAGVGAVKQGFHKFRSNRFGKKLLGGDTHKRLTDIESRMAGELDAEATRKERADFYEIR